MTAPTLRETSTRRSAPERAETPTGVAAPRRSGIRSTDLWAILGLNVVLVTGMWLRHGGLHTVSGPGGWLTAAGQLTGLYGTLAVLAMILLMSRSPWLERAIGRDRLVWGHRWIGFASVWLLVLHAVLITLGYAAGSKAGIWHETWALLTTYADVLMSAIGLALFLAIAFTSMRRARAKLDYETWYFVHLYAYLAVALSFAHQLAVGTDFVDDRVARAYWIVLYALTFGALVAFRLAQPLLLWSRHRTRVHGVVHETADTVSLYVGGKAIASIEAEPGQFFNLRFLTRQGWWRSHPFSLSAAPGGRYLRFTVKALGDWTTALQTLPAGTRVMLEGPYGAMTDQVRSRPDVLLIAGGVGLTPLKALLDRAAASPGQVTLLYRCSSWPDVLFRDELDAMAYARQATVVYLVGRRGTADMPTDPLLPQHLRHLCPDIAARDIYVCGPEPMHRTVDTSLAALMVPPAQVHSERFAY